MQHTTCHSFHACPLRSSSLLIVSKEKQTIVTATDEVFNMLGYEPTRLIGKSIDILRPRKSPSSSSCCYTLRHASCGDIPFAICSHFDPLANATDLEYWLIRPAQHTATMPNMHNNNSTTKGPVTILRLSPFGTIEHAYPSSEFPQKPHELRGHPIMSFVYKSDVRFLCERLSKLPKRTFATFKVRWLKQHPRHNMEDQFEWVAFTVMNSPRRLSCSALDDPQTRPTCIIQPIYDTVIDTEEGKEEYCSYDALWDTLLLPVRAGINTIYSTLDALHTAMDEGRSYVVQFLGHLITHFLKVSSELLYHAALEFEQYPNHKHQETTENTSNSKKEELLASGLSTCEANTIKVTLDNCIWSVPLLINNSLHKSNHSTPVPFTKQQNSTKSKHNKHHYL